MKSQSDITWDQNHMKTCGAGGSKSKGAPWEDWQTGALLEGGLRFWIGKCISIKVEKIFNESFVYFHLWYFCYSSVFPKYFCFLLVFLFSPKNFILFFPNNSYNTILLVMNTLSSCLSENIFIIHSILSFPVYRILNWLLFF